MTEAPPIWPMNAPVRACFERSGDVAANGGRVRGEGSSLTASTRRSYPRGAVLSEHAAIQIGGRNSPNSY